MNLPLNRQAAGQVFVWGNNECGKLGLDALDEMIIDPVDPTELIVPNTTWIQVVCCRYHTAAVSSNGELFTWGRGKYGLLGHGDNYRAVGSV